MLEFVKGDFFEYEADIMVNTVNCVGVMGAGVALAFKRKYPDMFKEYARQCKRGEIKPGKPTVWNSSDMVTKGVEVINFPTKDHWRKPSEYEYIETGLAWLSEYLGEKHGLTVTLPALGCGHGGLDWVKVKGMIEKYLEGSDNKILVFEPASSKNILKNNYAASENKNELAFYNVRAIDGGSVEYPESLKRYTERRLYVFPGSGPLQGFDVSVISSSQPSEEEMRVISDLIDFCDKSCLSMIFGASAFDKISASKATGNGIQTGVFLPTGILNSAKKIVESGSLENPSLFSVGDPKEKFNKSEYMPSVLSRIALSTVVIFTTSRLSWVNNNLKSLKSLSNRYYYVKYANIEAGNLEAVEKLSAEPIYVRNGVADFHGLTF